MPGTTTGGGLTTSPTRIFHLLVHHMNGCVVDDDIDAYTQFRIVPRCNIIDKYMERRFLTCGLLKQSTATVLPSTIGQPCVYIRHVGLHSAGILSY